MTSHGSEFCLCSCFCLHFPGSGITCVHGHFHGTEDWTLCLLGKLSSDWATSLALLVIWFDVSYDHGVTHLDLVLLWWSEKWIVNSVSKREKWYTDIICVLVLWCYIILLQIEGWLIMKYLKIKICLLPD